MSRPSFVDAMAGAQAVNIRNARESLDRHIAWGVGGAFAVGFAPFIVEAGVLGWAGTNPAIKEMLVELGAEALAWYFVDMKTEAYTDKQRYDKDAPRGQIHAEQTGERPKPRFRTRWTKGLDRVLSPFNY